MYREIRRLSRFPCVLQQGIRVGVCVDLDGRWGGSSVASGEAKQRGVSVGGAPFCNPESRAGKGKRRVSRIRTRVSMRVLGRGLNGKPPNTGWQQAFVPVTQGGQRELG